MDGARPQSHAPVAVLERVGHEVAHRLGQAHAVAAHGRARARLGELDAAAEDSRDHAPGERLVGEQVADVDEPVPHASHVDRESRQEPGQPE